MWTVLSCGFYLFVRCLILSRFYFYFQREKTGTSGDGDPNTDLINLQRPLGLWRIVLFWTQQLELTWNSFAHLDVVVFLFFWPTDVIRKAWGINFQACCLASCFLPCLVWRNSRLWQMVRGVTTVATKVRRKNKRKKFSYHRFAWPNGWFCQERKLYKYYKAISSSPSTLRSPCWFKMGPDVFLLMSTV